jgi:hypothetical protein
VPNKTRNIKKKKENKTRKNYKFFVDGNDFIFDDDKFNVDCGNEEDKAEEEIGKENEKEDKYFQGKNLLYPHSLDIMNFVILIPLKEYVIIFRDTSKHLEKDVNKEKEKILQKERKKERKKEKIELENK